VVTRWRHAERGTIREAHPFVGGPAARLGGHPHLDQAGAVRRGRAVALVVCRRPVPGGVLGRPLLRNLMVGAR
jgi:hypothetical protein